MSRIGNKPVAIPPGVEVKVDGQQVLVRGPLGTLSRSVAPGLTVSVANGHVEVKRAADTRRQRALHGLSRAEIQNMINGVAHGFERVLEISGVGFKAAVAGRTLNLSLGFTHPVTYPLPDGIEVTVEKQTILTIKGRDKSVVGQTAADIRALRPPDVYKAKGVKYAGEVLIRKEGKTGK